MTSLHSETWPRVLKLELRGVIHTNWPKATGCRGVDGIGASSKPNETDCTEWDTLQYVIQNRTAALSSSFQWKKTLWMRIRFYISHAINPSHLALRVYNRQLMDWVIFIPHWTFTSWEHMLTLKTCWFHQEETAEKAWQRTEERQEGQEETGRQMLDREAGEQDCSRQEKEGEEDEKDKVAFTLLGPTFRSRYSRSFFSCM